MTLAWVAVTLAVVVLFRLKLKKLSTIGLRSIEAPSWPMLLSFFDALSENFLPRIDGAALRTLVDIELVAVSRAMIPFYQGLTTESSFLCKMRFFIFCIMSSSSTSLSLSWSLAAIIYAFWIFLSCFIIPWRIYWTCFLFVFLSNETPPWATAVPSPIS